MVNCEKGINLVATAIMNPQKEIQLVVLGFNATLTAKVISWQSVTHVFPGFLTPVLTQLFFPKPPTSFLTCFCRGEPGIKPANYNTLDISLPTNT